MKLEVCGTGIQLLVAPKTALPEMIEVQIAFQKRLGMFDGRCDRVRVIHSLDLALMEAAEAYDQLEGGWKHHKRNPKSPDWNEVAMELVDVACFVLNAAIYSGNDIVVNDLDAIWRSSSSKRYARSVEMYSHANGAYGDQDVKNTATAVRHMMAALVDYSEHIRRTPDEWVMDERITNARLTTNMRNIARAFQCIPNGAIDYFYSAFMHKARINHQRQDNGY